MSEVTTSPDPDAVLQAHDTHVFVFTSAGKPVFSLHGDANAFASLFAVLRVLMQMCSEGAVLGNSGSSSSTGGALQYIRCGPAGLALYFLAKDELYCVLATRRHATPAQAQYCAVQLNYVHRLIFAMVPNLRAILTHEPSRDACALFSQADMDVLRDLVADDDDATTSDSANSHVKWQCVSRALPHMTMSLCRLFHGLPSCALRSGQREWLEGVLLRVYQRSLVQPLEAREHDSRTSRVQPKDISEDELALPLTVWLVYRNVILAALGPHEARQPVAYLDATSSTTNNNSSTKTGKCLAMLTARQREDAQQSARYALSTSDALILMHFASSLRGRRQRGEAWAPLCLWDFNKTGYVWVYVASLQEHTHAQAPSSTQLDATHDNDDDDDELYVVQVSCSQHNFLALSGFAQGIAQSITQDSTRYLALLAELRAPCVLQPSVHSTPTAANEPVWVACVMRSQVAPHVVTLPSVILSVQTQCSSAMQRHECEGRVAALWSRLQVVASQDMPLVIEEYISSESDDGCVGLALCPSAKVLQLLYQAELSTTVGREDDEEEAVSHHTIDRLHAVLTHTVYALLVAFPRHLAKAHMLATCHALLLHLATGVQEPTTWLVRQRRVGLRA